MADPDIGAMVGAWNALVRRARIGRERKHVALTLSSYADPDGTNIYCGIASLAVDCEIGYSTARRYLAWLRNVGLVELVKHGNQRRGLSDEYRLILGPDVLEQIDLPDPDQYHGLKAALRDANRAGSAKRSGRVRENLRSPRVSADDAGQSGAAEDGSALALVSAEPSDLRSPREPSALTQDERPPSLYTSPEELTSPSIAGDHSPEAAGPCAREAPQDRDSSSEEAAPDLRSSDRLAGHGCCLPCYAEGKFTVAADPVNGSHCHAHLRRAA